jgi:hypothetical protein
MVVSKLIEKLKKCNPNALVNVECCSDATANKVVKYTDGSEEIIYVCDDESLIDETLIDRQGFKKEVL